jgi:hypothetical protein
MPEFLQNVDLGGLTLIVVGCGLLCVVGFLLVFGLQIIVGAIGGFIEIFFSILAGGPVAWCGCGLFLVACLIVTVIGIFIVNTMSSCDTNPIMFCRLLGYS